MFSYAARRRNGERYRAGSRAFFEQRNEARHVRTFAVIRQRNVDIARRDRRVCDAIAIHEWQRIAQAFDADLVDRDAALIPSRLHIGDRHENRGLLGAVHDEHYIADAYAAGLAQAPDLRTAKRARIDAAMPFASRPTCASITAGSP